MNFAAKEFKVFKKLSSPEKIQDFIDSLAINFENGGDTCSSPLVVLQRKTAHCIEAALLAAAVMIYHKKQPYLLDLKSNQRDFDHVVCLFKANGRWGAISKSNHLALRYRDPVYLSPRELAMSYFHEYTNPRGEKTLRSYSKPFSLGKYESDWVVSEENLWVIAEDLDEAKHFDIVPKHLRVRNADRFEKYLGNLPEWSQKSGKMLKYTK